MNMIVVDMFNVCSCSSEEELRRVCIVILYMDTDNL